VKIAARIVLAIALVGLFLSQIVVTQFPVLSTSTSFAIPSSLTVAVEPLPLELYCPGAFAEVGGESGIELGQIDRIGEASIYQFLGSGELIVDPGLTTTPGARLVAVGDNQSTGLLSVIQSQGIARDRAVGLMATTCSQPLFSGWFISGAAALGQETVLLLANPSESETLVSLQFLVPGGKISKQVSLAAGQTVVLPVSSVIFQESMFSLWFETSGVPISVAMQQRATAGLSTRGVDMQLPSVATANDNLITGLSVRSEGFDKPVLRLFNFGDIATEAVITAVSSNNVVVLRQQVQSEGFAEIELDLTDGDYLVRVESVSPLLAGIKNTILKPVVDFSWLTQSSKFTDLTIPIPSYKTRLHVANFGSTALAVNLEITNGTRVEYQSFEIASLSQVSLPISGDSIRINSASEFTAALEVIDVPGYAVINPRENQNFGDALSVSVR
tara:strand:+ start:2615 stop:3946 length:1332 start_codon:yes stop_codon:yes gene_type:complete